MLALISKEWRFLLFGFLMTFWSSPGQTFFISLFSGQMRAELGLSDGQFGGIYSLATLASAILMVWSGSLVDRIHLRRFSIAVVCGLAAGCVAVSMSVGLVTLVLGIFLLRQMGQGLMSHSSSTAMVRYLEHDKGKASALASMGYAVSEAVMPSVVVLLIAAVGWRQGWLAVAAALLIFMLPAIYLFLRGHDSRHRAYETSLAAEEINGAEGNRQRQWNRREVIRDGCFYLFLPGLMSQQLMFTGFIFHQIHLVESKGWSIQAWASFFAIYALVSVVSKLVTGIFVDRIGAIRLVPVVGLPMALGLVILGIDNSLYAGFFFLIFMGITVGSQSTVTGPFWAEMYGRKHLGSIKSLGAAVMVLFTATSPVVLGVLIDLGVSIEALAIGGAVYTVLGSTLALFASSIALGRLDSADAR